MEARHRQLVARVAAPIAFLAAVTLAVVVARSALVDETPARRAGVTAPATTAPAATAPATTATTTTAPATTAAQETEATFHVVESGDTLAAIAAEYGTTVEAIVELNPGIDPVALTIGQRVRVG